MRDGHSSIDEAYAVAPSEEPPRVRDTRKSASSFLHLKLRDSQRGAMHMHTHKTLGQSRRIRPLIGRRVCRAALACQKRNLCSTGDCALLFVLNDSEDVKFHAVRRRPRLELYPSYARYGDLWPSLARNDALAACAMLTPYFWS